MLWPLVLIGGGIAGLAWLFRTSPLAPSPPRQNLDPALDPVLSPASLISFPVMSNPQTENDLVTATGDVGVIAAMADPTNMVPVDFNGQTWLVAPQPIGPAGIGAAQQLAHSLGLELPSPGLVDAIWRAADLKIVPPVRASDGTPRTMSSPEVYAAQKARIEGLIAGRSFRLLAGTHKDIVMGDAQSFASAGGSGLKPGKIGLYGWHSEVPIPGVALHAAVTGVGKVIQQPFGGHGLDWGDYSQAVRLVRRA